MFKNDKVYLVDFGLAHRFKRESTHSQYKERPKNRHDGTLLYTSRDSHKGVAQSRRSDLENLGYCMVHWVSGTLPWIHLLSNPNEVENLKILNMLHIQKFLETLFKNENNYSGSLTIN